MPERLAHAKINLRLCVLAREASGYHQIETLLCRVTLADRLAVEPADDLSLIVRGLAAGPVDDNLVLRAARTFFEATGIRGGAAFRLIKEIPAGAGLGGGSSDAAAALHLLNRMYDEPLAGTELLRLGFALGSDIPFFVTEALYALAWGRGERLLPLPPLPARPVLIVAPSIGIATADAYRELARSREGSAAAESVALPPHALTDWDGVQSIMRNDFDAVADRTVATVAELRAILTSANASAVQLTGSGSALFALFDDEQAMQAAADAVRARHSDTLVFPVATLAGGS